MGNHVLGFGFAKAKPMPHWAGKGYAFKAQAPCIATQGSFVLPGKARVLDPQGIQHTDTQACDEATEFME